MELKELQDRHKGKMAFVVGAGPSLHFQDVSPLKDYVTISVNSGLLKVPFSDYFLSDDIGAKNWNYYVHLLPTLEKTVSLLYAQKLRLHARRLDKNRVVWFEHKWWFDPKSKQYNPEGLVLTKEAEKPIIGARTSMGSAVHFAYIMGCDPIVLLGSDCCYRDGKRYFWQYSGEPKAYRVTHEPVFATPNAGTFAGKQIDTHGRDFIIYWANLSEQTQKAGIDIIDASGGVLTCFKKMTLPEVLSAYADRKR